MIVRDLIERANLLADDLIDESEVLGYCNDALAAIGAEVNAILPVVTLDDEPALPERWQLLLLVPFMKGRIKEKDSSQFEWEAGYEQFFENMQLFRTRYRMPIEYKVLTMDDTIIVNDTEMRIESDETLYSIAQDENTTVQAILDENGGKDNIPVHETEHLRSDITTSPPFMYGGW